MARVFRVWPWRTEKGPTRGPLAPIGRTTRLRSALWPVGPTTLKSLGSFSTTYIDRGLYKLNTLVPRKLQFPCAQNASNPRIWWSADKGAPQSCPFGRIGARLGRGRSAEATLRSSRWSLSSVGRAPPRQGGGHWFEPSSDHIRARTTTGGTWAARRERLSTSLRRVGSGAGAQLQLTANRPVRIVGRLDRDVVVVRVRC